MVVDTPPDSTDTFDDSIDTLDDSIDTLDGFMLNPKHSHMNVATLGLKQCWNNQQRLSRRILEYIPATLGFNVMEKRFNTSYIHSK